MLRRAARFAATWVTLFVGVGAFFVYEVQIRGKSLYRAFKRVRQLREFADKPESQCRWAANLYLFADSKETLANFRLHTLCQRSIFSCTATNKQGNVVFEYSRLEPWYNINCFDDKLHPKYDSWWFWPMETVLDYDELESSRTGSS